MYNLEMTFNRKHLATYIIAGVTTLYWLVQVFTFGSSVATGQNLWNAGALFGNWIVTVDPGQIWRLITPVFVHLSWMHILLNMFTLVFIGRMIEEIFGSLRFVGIYFLSSIFAYSCVFFFQNNTMTAGASTAIFGIFGAIGTLGYFTGDPRLKEIGKSFIALIVINLLLNLLQTDVSIVGHIGGVVGGGLLAAIFPPKAYAKWIPSYVRVLSVMTFVVLLLLFIILPFAGVL